MADICHSLFVDAPREAVFEAAATPQGMKTWWTDSSDGKPVEGAVYQLLFARGLQWSGLVRRYDAPAEFELEITDADDDWIGTTIEIRLASQLNRTALHFRHRTSWQTDDERFAISNYCWAQYLRAMKRNLETRELIPYEKRI